MIPNYPFLDERWLLTSAAQLLFEPLVPNERRNSSASYYVCARVYWFGTQSAQRRTATAALQPSAIVSNDLHFSVVR